MKKLTAQICTGWLPSFNTEAYCFASTLCNEATSWTAKTRACASITTKRTGDRVRPQSVHGNTRKRNRRLQVGWHERSRSCYALASRVSLSCCGVWGGFPLPRGLHDHES
ncbi:hypothetical protein V6N13_004542 [Hibiscus sabdariffa]